MTLDWLCTREDVVRGMDVPAPSRITAQIDRAVGAGTVQVDRLCHRSFRPWTGTRYFPFPNHQYARSGRLYLGQHDLISAISITSGGTVITGYLLEPVNSGPPYTRIDLDDATSAAWAAGPTTNRSIAIAGVWGYGDDETVITTLASSATSGAATLALTVAAGLGVGDLIRVDSERMVITGWSWSSSGQTLGGNLTASLTDQMVSVSNGSLFAVGELILIDSERMMITDIAGNTLVVRRAIDGTTLASHTATTTVYAQRAATVDRAVRGTTAAAHNSAAVVYRHDVPPLIRSLAVAESIAQYHQELSGYGRTVGTGDNQREARGAALAELRDRVESSRLARRVRKLVV